MGNQVIHNADGLVTPMCLRDVVWRGEKYQRSFLLFSLFFLRSHKDAGGQDSLSGASIEWGGEGGAHVLHCSQ